VCKGARRRSLPSLPPGQKGAALVIHGGQDDLPGAMSGTPDTKRGQPWWAEVGHMMAATGGLAPGSAITIRRAITPLPR
jgi:hypothetical protein